jgi:hypothetical protein
MYMAFRFFEILWSSVNERKYTILEFQARLATDPTGVENKNWNLFWWNMSSAIFNSFVQIIVFFVNCTLFYFLKRTMQIMLSKINLWTSLIYFSTQRETSAVSVKSDSRFTVYRSAINQIDDGNTLI